MSEIIAINGEKILVDDEEYEIACKFKWRITKEGAATTSFKNKKYTFSKLIYKIEPGQVVYHKNNDPLDYRRDNIIICSKKISGYLATIEREKNNPDKKSRYYGVMKVGNGWIVRYKNKSGRKVQEKYELEEEAALAADYYAVTHYGDFARRNFIGMDFDELAQKYKIIRNITDLNTKKRRSKIYQGKLKGNNKTKYSKYIGVTWDHKRNKWAASVTYLKKRISLGRYDTEIDAAIMYDKKVVDLFGIDASKNFPEFDLDELNKRYNSIVSEMNKISYGEKLSRGNQGKSKLPQERKTSKYVGVYWNKKFNKWVTQITHNYKCFKIGYYDSEIEAAKAYDEKALELYGEAAKLNSYDCI
jgi:hypothetical protein